MTKVKTHKGLSKVIKIRKNGTITFKQVGLNHKSGKKSGAVNRSKRKSTTLSKADQNRLTNLI